MTQSLRTVFLALIVTVVLSAGLVNTVFAQTTGVCVYSDGRCTAGKTAEACRQEGGSYGTDRTCSLTFEPNVKIPGLFEGSVPVDETLFGRYVASFYIFFLGVAGILAVVVMMWGGFHYITSAGNPQKMNQGKEIISNAVIGLIILLTSYLLLRLINPRLIVLRIPTIAYVNQVLQPQRYCEAQGALAIAAVKQQNKTCGAEVEYTDENGKKKTCTTLYIPNMDGLALKGQLACYPVVTTPEGKVTIDYVRKLAYVLCEDKQYTDDATCSGTQQLLSLQTWLKGACKKADMKQSLVRMSTGKDICKYRAFLHCGSNEVAVSCNAGGGRDTGCWEDGKPRSDETGEGIISHCREPSSNVKIIEHVDGLCCQMFEKKHIDCREEAGCADNQVQVSCSQYNSQSGNYRCLIGGLIPCVPRSLCDEDERVCCADLNYRYLNPTF